MSMEVDLILQSIKSLELFEIFPQGVVVFDLETNGLSPLCDHVIEVAAIKATPSDEGPHWETFHHLVHPERPIGEDTLKVHGITNEMVQDAPAFFEVLPQFLKFSQGLPLLAHNAQFDVGFLAYFMHQKKFPFPKNPVYCGLKFARKAHKKSPNFKLSSLAQFLEVPTGQSHRAMDDTLASLLIWEKGVVAAEASQFAFLLKESFLTDLSQYQDFEFDLDGPLKGLDSFARKKQLIDMKYSGGNHKGKWRPIRPVSLLPMPQGPILYAHCLLSDQYKTFLLKKIKEIKALNAQEMSSRLQEFNKLKSKS